MDVGGQVLLPYLSTPHNVMVKGIDPATFDRVTNYRDSLWWFPLDKPLPKDRERQDVRLNPDNRAELEGLIKEGATLTTESAHGPAAAGSAAMVTGVEVGGYSDRAPGGWLVPYQSGGGPPILLGRTGTLSGSVRPGSASSRAGSSVLRFWKSPISVSSPVT